MSNDDWNLNYLEHQVPFNKCFIANIYSKFNLVIKLYKISEYGIQVGNIVAEVM